VADVAPALADGYKQWTMNGAHNLSRGARAGLLLFLVSACTDARTPSSTLMQPLPERRARVVVERALSDSGAEPAPGRTLTLERGDALHEDVAVA
jgi:hypothetical protein